MSRLGLGALEWEERGEHPTLWRFVTLYNIVSQTDLDLLVVGIFGKPSSTIPNLNIDYYSCTGTVGTYYSITPGL